jgi:putative tryptophan/tyrosine transport system substrate-binding protein
MRRREFIQFVGGAAVAWPLAARAQQAAMPVIGFLNPSSPETSHPTLDSFRSGLLESGFVEGRNVRIEYRWAEGHYDKLPELASDLVKRQVNVIVAGGSSAPCLAAKAATSTIPIAFQTGADPVADRLVESMNRPGGNVTGVSRMAIALDPKRLELLHEVVPEARVIAFMINPDSQRAEAAIEQIQKAAKSLALAISVVNVTAESDPKDAFALLKNAGAGALLYNNDPAMQRWGGRIAALTIENAIPAMFNVRSYVLAGGLMSYDASLIDSYRQLGVYVGRILKGEKPADLPILQPTKFDLIINLKTAKALGLSIPQTLLATADEVIE